MNETHNVVVHKANIPLLKGESLKDFTCALREAGRKHVMQKQNLPSKGVDVYMVEAFSDHIVFDVYWYGENAVKDKQMQFFAVPYKRGTDGKFEFGDTMEVRRVTTYEPVSSVTKATTVPVSKPFPNEHAARQTEPGKYTKFRRGALAPGVDAIYGITPAGKSEVQSLRFDSKKFTEAQAKTWLKDHKFSAAKFEIASGPKKSTTKQIGNTVSLWEETEKTFWNGVL